MSIAYKCDRCGSYNDSSNPQYNVTLPGRFADKVPNAAWLFWHTHEGRNNDVRLWLCKKCTNELVDIVEHWFNHVQEIDHE